MAADLPGAGLPVRRTRCINFTAVEAPTSNRAAACRIERPPSTERTIRWRRSGDNGAVMANLLGRTPITPESDNLIHCKAKLL